MSSLDIYLRWADFHTGRFFGRMWRYQPGFASFLDMQREVLLLRAQVAALKETLLSSSVITAEKFDAQIEIASESFIQEFVATYPGVTTDDDRVIFDGDASLVTCLELGIYQPLADITK